ncbi:lytic transglycosylase domain-containing protein [Candidatus Pacearchaeota archaeon]|nr:lytic transglycosylase domain-containing protein [Candidatus Pacearchaeota archaeon]
MQEKDDIVRRKFLSKIILGGVISAVLPRVTYPSSGSTDYSDSPNPFIDTALVASAALYSETSPGSGDSRRSILHPFQKGDTVGELRFHYGDERHERDIIGDHDPRKIPVGAEFEFLADRERFERYGLTPDPKELGNWEAITQMNGSDFFRMLNDFSYKGDHRKHLRLIPGLKLGDYEKDSERQMENLDRLRDHIHHFAKIYEIKPIDMASVILQESGVTPRAISTSGAMGICQLMPAIAARWNETNPWNEIQGIEKGARYLGHLSNICASFPGLEIVGYNAGDGAVESIVKIAKERGMKNLRGILASSEIFLKQEARDYPLKVAQAREKILRLRPGKFT